MATGPGGSLKVSTMRRWLTIVGVLIGLCACSAEMNRLSSAPDITGWFCALSSQSRTASVTRTSHTAAISSPVRLTAMRTVFAGGINIGPWQIATTQRDWNLRPRFFGKDAWRSWTLQTESGTLLLSTVFSGDDAWKHWRITGSGVSVRVNTTWRGDDAWKSWTVTGPSGTNRVSTVFSGDDAWKHWRGHFPSGTLSLSVRFSGKDGWHSWTIADRTRNVTDAEKAATLLASLISTFYRHDMLNP